MRSVRFLCGIAAALLAAQSALSQPVVTSVTSGRETSGNKRFYWEVKADNIASFKFTGPKMGDTTGDSFTDPANWTHAGSDPANGVYSWSTTANTSGTIKFYYALLNAGAGNTADVKVDYFNGDGVRVEQSVTSSLLSGGTNSSGGSVPGSIVVPVPEPTLLGTIGTMLWLAGRRTRAGC